MGAPKGNQFWLARSSHGRDLIFKDPKTLWDSCVQYFQWCEDHPLKETRVFANSNPQEVPKMRAMTLAGLCIFLDIDDSTWEDYRERDDFIRVTKKAERIIYNQKFTGASADLLNANIIARDLGLVDKQAKEHDVSDGVKKLLTALSNQDADLPNDFEG